MKETAVSLRQDVTQLYEIKSVLEQLFGNQAWLDLKECTSLSKWKRHTLRLVKAIRLSIEESVEIRDQPWMDEVNENLDRGMKSIRASKSVEAMLSGFCATILRQVFLQIGMIPNRRSVRKVPLTRENWRLNAHRSVQYVQTAMQVERLFWSEQQRRIGFEKQMELRSEYRTSNSKLAFSEWCREHHV